MSLARGTWEPWPLTIGLVIATVWLYWSGMILNDLFDVEEDRVRNRGRPLVDGNISLSTARFAGYTLLTMAIVMIAGVGAFYSRSDGTVASMSFGYLSTVFVALALAACIYLYDGPLKSTFFGPILMGLCRVGSLLIGISVSWWLSPHTTITAPYLWLAAFGNGVYVTGITWSARREAEGKQNLGLPLGWTICGFGIAMLASVAWFAPTGTPMRLRPYTEYPIAVVLMALPWARRAIRSVVQPSPSTIQAAVKQAILSIIFFDALLALQFAGPYQAMIVCGLIFPALWLGKKFRST